MRGLRELMARVAALVRPAPPKPKGAYVELANGQRIYGSGVWRAVDDARKEQS